MELVTVGVICLMINCVFTQDPCQDFKELPDMFRRYTSYTTDIPNGETDICDRYLLNGVHWYYADVDMPTSPPPLFSCGTQYPIWLNGTIPLQLHETTWGQACVVKSTSRPCDVMYSIAIKNCGNFNVYKLINTDACPEAYCFGNGILDTPPSEILPLPHVTPFLRPVDFDGSVRDMLAFKCVFGDSGILQSAFYQVTWLLNSNAIVTKIAAKTELEKLNLFEDHLTALDIQLSCVVRPKNLENGRPGSSAKSDEFYAGIKVKQTTLSLYVEGKTQLEFELTVPVGCMWRSGSRQDCEFYIQMSVPGNSGDKCSGTIASNAFRCNTKISSNKWNSTTSIDIKYKGEGKYPFGFPHTFLMRLYISSDHEIWNMYNFPNIQVNVLENAGFQKYQGRSCHSYNDPHMQTLNGRKYEHHMAGVYTLYEHEDQKRKMEVQIKLAACASNIYCNCGVAVRAGGDVFIIDLCGKHHIMEFQTCHDKILDVRRFRLNEKLYSIFFPTGTKVAVSINGKYLNVVVHPSAFDFNNTRGLCGFFNGVCGKEFILRDGTSSGNIKTKEGCRGQTYTYMYPTDFSQSWRVKTNDDLFELEKDDQTIELWDANDKVCNCPEDKPTEGHFECSPQTSVTCERDKDYNPVGSETCFALTHGRKRRSVLYPKTAFHRIEKRNAEASATQKLKMTEAEAKNYCKEALGGSKIFQRCSQLSNVNSEEALEACALDIQLTNSLEWLSSTMESFKFTCINELQMNSTLSNITENGELSIAAQIKEMLCPGFPECSNNGICVNGTCVCEEDFIASDCSKNKTIPPEIVGVRGDGLCDLREISCNTAFMVGQDIGNSDQLSCKVKEYLIDPNGKRLNISSWISDARLDTITEVHCPLAGLSHIIEKRDVANENNRFIQGFSLSISYDGINFGNPLDLLIFDSKCQLEDLSETPPRFALKESTCFIDNKCYLLNEENTSDKCKVCDPMSPYVWSVSSMTQGCIRLEQDRSITWITAPIVGGIAVAVIIIGVFIVYKTRSRSKVNTVQKLQN